LSSRQRYSLICISSVISACWRLMHYNVKNSPSRDSNPLDPEAEAIVLLDLRLARTLYGWLNFMGGYGLTTLRRLMAGKFGVRLRLVSLIDTFPSVSSAFQPSMPSASIRGLDYKQT